MVFSQAARGHQAAAAYLIPEVSTPFGAKCVLVLVLPLSTFLLMDSHVDPFFVDSKPALPKDDHSYLTLDWYRFVEPANVGHPKPSRRKSACRTRIG